MQVDDHGQLRIALLCGLELINLPEQLLVVRLLFIS